MIDPVTLLKDIGPSDLSAWRVPRIGGTEKGREWFVGMLDQAFQVYDNMMEDYWAEDREAYLKILGDILDAVEQVKHADDAQIEEWIRELIERDGHGI